MSASAIQRFLLIAAMAAGSIVMWVVNPVAWIWAVSKLADSTQVTMTQIVVLLAGIPGTMIVVGRGLGRLNQRYGHVTGTAPTIKVVAPWHRSMRDERDAGHPRSVLDVVMVASVGVALLLMAIWFAFFAEGGGLPN